MTAERWQQVKTIFHAVADSDPSLRPSLVREACGDDEELRSEVESLLASDRDAGSRIEHPVLEPSVLPGSTVVTQVLKNRYEIDRELGRGGMSVVYLARDRELLSKRVVVKVLLDETSQDSWIRQKFQQEMEALSRIDHPGVVGVLDTGVTPEGKQFLVMQYIEGSSLRSAIQAGGMKKDRAAGVIRQIGQALAAAHEKGVWHRDLKPENIMLQSLGGEDHVKLIDFGIAGVQDSQFAGEKTQVAGSLAYMAPEQLGGNACAASDTYALGVVAYELLAGERPQTQSQYAVPVPEEALRSIRKAMSLRPEDRQGSVREFSEELYQALWSGETARKMAAPGSVEIAHVLFTDLVGYSLLPMDQQKQYLAEFQQIVRGSPRFVSAEAAGDIISLPTGDGMALAFFGDPTAPAQCALEVAERLKEKPHLRLRMGIHSGPVYRVADVNANANVAGGGINMAQRVMDCGDAGHILVSKTVADVLLQLSQWAPHLADLGECSVKHGVTVHLYNLTTADAGNRELPSKLKMQQPKPAKMSTRSRWPLLTALAVVLVLAVSLLYAYMARSSTPKSPSPSPTTLLQYYVMVQKYRDGKPYEQPFRLSGERVFEAGYQVKLVITSPLDAYLYVVNEGAKSTFEKPDVNSLFPSPAIQSGSRLSANGELSIPPGGFFQFDKEKGVEKLWVVWSRTPIPELEALTKWATPQYRGSVGDIRQARAILNLLESYPKATTRLDDQSTILAGSGKTVAHLIKLDHD